MHNRQHPEEYEFESVASSVRRFWIRQAFYGWATSAALLAILALVALF